MCSQLSAVKRRQVIGVRPRAHTDDGRRNGVRLTRLDYGTPLLFVAPFFVVFGLFGLVPLVSLAWVSLHRWHLVNGDEGFVGLANYLSLFADPNFYLGLFQSFAPGPGNDEIVVVDEETAAVARIASDKTIPFIAFRALSDSSAADRGGDPLMLPGFPVTFFFYAQLAADNAAAVALEFLARWSP